MIERFGTGIRRIKDLYSNNGIKPQFIVITLILVIALIALRKGQNSEKNSISK